MKVIQINTVFPSGSTGKICKGIMEQCACHNIDHYVAYACSKSQSSRKELVISSWWDNHIHNRLARITMSIGCFSYFHTKAFLRKLKDIEPDILHLHNIHGNYINLNLLFKYIKKHHLNVVWTLHDCWSYTGYCAYYSMVGCDKWKMQCMQCPNRHLDSVTVFDRSSVMFRKKRAMFSNVHNMTLVTPSRWLKKEVEQSFLKNYPIRVIHNGIDLNVFRPRKSAFRNKYCITDDQFLVLGVAFGWEKRKGLEDFLLLLERLPQSYRIVLVGTNDMIDKELPEQVISIHRTQSQIELAEIYTAADVFVNPTKEENYPTVNLEAIACGTPVITYDAGGCGETVDETCGSVVERGDIDSLEKEIIRICENKPYTEEACLSRAKAYDMRARFEEYVDLYEEIVNDRTTKS